MGMARMLKPRSRELAMGERPDIDPRSFRPVYGKGARTICSPYVEVN
jgi:hypothetical protein